ncbi:hypothetical protein ElyMa_003041400 [Elysia marginata]|uniref:Secreted protein n=1 Tax=Elysia marginata TaxID=1093978 RepID=A0AAV4IEC1_9GAST|nr:hypothetical protein ElyMa_003041400 [Elysia marginata]
MSATVRKMLFPRVLVAVIVVVVVVVAAVALVVVVVVIAVIVVCRPVDHNRVTRSSTECLASKASQGWLAHPALYPPVIRTTSLSRPLDSQLEQRARDARVCEFHSISGRTAHPLGLAVHGGRQVAIWRPCLIGCDEVRGIELHRDHCYRPVRLQLLLYREGYRLL